MEAPWIYACNEPIGRAPVRLGLYLKILMILKVVL